MVQLRLRADALAAPPLSRVFTAGSAVNYDDLRPLIAVGITSSVLLAQHFGCSKPWINLEHGTLTANLLPAGWRVHS
jgi:hypothetical protein